MIEEKIDNLKFTRFVLSRREMNEHEKKQFIEAVPKLTEDEKAEIVLSIFAGQTLDLYGELREKLADPSYTQDQVTKIEDDFLAEKRKEHVEKEDQSQIEHIKEDLKNAS